MTRNFLLTISLCVLSVASMFAKEHEIERGETAASIASKYGITEDRLFELNPIAKDMFYTGMVLIVPDEEDNSFDHVVSDSIRVPENVIVEAPHVYEPEKQWIVDSAYDYDSGRQSKDAGSLKHRTYKEDVSRYDGFFGIYFQSGSFEHVKETGCYGFTGMLLPWRLAGNLYIGFDYSLGFNFGLLPSDFTSVLISVGPALGYYFTSNIFVSLPLDVTCNVFFKKDENNKDTTSTSWGMTLTPMFNIGKKFGLFVGPMLNWGFSGESKLNCGFKVGLSTTF